MDAPQFKIELRNITHNARLSEETECFAAKLYVNDVYIADASNHGQGGCTDFSPKQGQRERLEEVEAYCKTLPALPSEYFPAGLPMDLELFVGDLLEKHLKEREVKRLLKKNVLYKTEKGIMSCSWKGVAQITVREIDIVKAKYQVKPEDILNLMAMDQAVAAFTAGARQ